MRWLVTLVVGGFGGWFLFRDGGSFFPETDETGLFLDDGFGRDVGFGFGLVLEVGSRAEDSTFKGQWRALLSGDFDGNGSIFRCGKELNRWNVRFIS